MNIEYIKLYHIVHKIDMKFKYSLMSNARSHETYRIKLVYV
jgi:hypothetical protein